MENELITIPEAARMKGVTRQAIHDALNKGRLAYVEVLEPVRKIQASELARFRVNRKRQDAGKAKKIA